MNAGKFANKPKPDEPAKTVTKVTKGTVVKLFKIIQQISKNRFSYFETYESRNWVICNFRKSIEKINLINKLKFENL